MNEENNNEKPSQIPIRKEDHSHKVFSMMTVYGTTGMLSWIIMFSLGLLIDSQIYRNNLLTQFDLSNFIMSILTFTPTNIALLCIISAFTGGCASKLVIAGIVQKSDPGKIPKPDKLDSYLYMAENPFSSMLRGLVVYFFFLAGVFIATSNPFANTTSQQYAQSAGVVSLLSFVVGYDPTVFRSLLSLAEKIKQKNSNDV